MPSITKGAVASFFRNTCDRRVGFDLLSKEERKERDIPPPFRLEDTEKVRGVGDEWERRKIAELKEAFGEFAVTSPPETNDDRQEAVWLATSIANLQPGRFLSQAEFTVGDYIFDDLGFLAAAKGLDLRVGNLRPDLIQVLPPGFRDAPTGVSVTPWREILPGGSVRDVVSGDPRRQLRIIDVKLSDDTSIYQLGEVTYYALALASWLRANGLDKDFLVTGDPSVWAGSKSTSSIATWNANHLRSGSPGGDWLSGALVALKRDLVAADPVVFLPTLKHFLSVKVPAIARMPWTELEWQVALPCELCGFLGYPWPEKYGPPKGNYCWLMARQQGHLSMVPFLSRGARKSLEEYGIDSVGSLASTGDGNPAFTEHPKLRADEDVIRARARSLVADARHLPGSHIPTGTGQVTSLPRWADLHLFVKCEYSSSHDRLFALGLKAVSYGQEISREYRARNASVFIVEEESPEAERKALTEFLAYIGEALRIVEGSGGGDERSFQLYFWDDGEQKALLDAIGRHIDFIFSESAASSSPDNLKALAWLLPPGDEVLPNPDLSVRRSPMTVIRSILADVVALPIPHYYNLYDVVNAYRKVDPSFPMGEIKKYTPMSTVMAGRIPFDKMVEVWLSPSVDDQDNSKRKDLIVSVQREVRKKLWALSFLTSKLRASLDASGKLLSARAPLIKDVSPPFFQRGMAVDSNFWYVFAWLNHTIATLEHMDILAMTPEKRIVKFHSARLSSRIDDAAAATILARYGLEQTPAGITRFVYALQEGSRDVKAKEGDRFLVTPQGNTEILSKPLAFLLNGRDIPRLRASLSSPMDRLLTAAIRVLDRDGLIVVIDMLEKGARVLKVLEECEVVDFKKDVLLDPLYRNTSHEQLKEALLRIGNPSIAKPFAGAAKAIGVDSSQVDTGQFSPILPAAEVLWAADRLADEETGFTAESVVASRTKSAMGSLDESQLAAWRAALSRRFSLIWGPPGTGKSRTLRAIVAGAIYNAAARKKPLRILITGPTYQAIDNVFVELLRKKQLLTSAVSYHRLRSSSTSDEIVSREPLLQSVDVKFGEDADAVKRMVKALSGEQTTVVGATPYQVWKLVNSLAKTGKSTELFDFVVVDEASQVNVGMTVLALSGLAAGGAVSVVGDPLQLPPIIKARAPKDMETLVGSAYVYFAKRFGIKPNMLSVNYRSCAEVVAAARKAGYPDCLRPDDASAGQRIRLVAPLPSGDSPPDVWTHLLPWTGDWGTLLDPDSPVGCFIYPDGRSNQSNEFEAGAIAASLSLLSGRLSGDGVSPYDPVTFWTRGVGIVTPHKAQQALVVSKLQCLFPDTDKALIRGAVDTVERFQGQERDVILATYALGDPESIAAEDEFLLNRNRFNVMVSRARKKLLVFASRELVDHLSSELDVLGQSAMLKGFVEHFCRNAQTMSLPYRSTAKGAVVTVTGTFRRP